ncbi:MAG: AAA family ATPase, partial [Tomitella sp.]|nr:AAA family ATPase [Tomitella sp.]
PKSFERAELDRMLREARVLVAAQIREAAGRVPVNADVVDRLREAGALLDADLVSGLEHAQSTDADDVLAPGARVCFTGYAFRPDGAPVSRDEMLGIAAARGLTPVNNVTKTKCDVLVTAEVGSQSGKARKAREWGKPVVSAKEFLDWAEGR